MVRETKACGKQWSGSNQAGITLLEMLVVFALVSLISTLLLQFTGFLTSGFERTASMEREAFRSRLFQRWYQNSTAGIVASSGWGGRFPWRQRVNDRIYPVPGIRTLRCADPV